MRRILAVFLALTIGLFSAPGLTQDQYSGFLADYEQLEPTDDLWLNYIYMGPEFLSKLAGTTAFVLEQPEIFIADGSKYKGMKPDDMKLLADSMRAVMAEALVRDFQIAASPGPNTLIFRMALTNVHLKKKGRGLLGYTPVGFVASSAKKAMMNDFVDNILLTEVVWEGEMLDSQTGKQIGAVILNLGDKGNKREYTSWEQLMLALEVGSERFLCRIQNARSEEDEFRNCLAEITGM